MSTLRRALEEGAAALRLVALARHLDRQRPNVLRVLAYHRVAEPDQGFSGDPNLLSATPDAFAAQVEYLLRHYTPVNGEAVAQAVAGEGVLPPQALLVTFDDGYRDFRLYAWPVLRRYGVPAVLFVPTAYPAGERRFWWDTLFETISRARRPLVRTGEGTEMPLRTPQERVAAVRLLNRELRLLRPQEIEETLRALQMGVEADSPPAVPLLSWEDLRILVREGLAVAPHTRHHPVLPVLPEEELEGEVEGACADLRRELGGFAPIFAYPLGVVDPRVGPRLRAQGIVAAFSTRPGVNALGKVDPYALARRAINASRSFAEFCLSCTTVYAQAQHWWLRYRHAPSPVN